MKYAPITSVVNATVIPNPSDRPAWGEFLAFCMDNHVEICRATIEEVTEDSTEHPGEQVLVSPQHEGYTLGYKGPELQVGNYLVNHAYRWRMFSVEEFESKYVPIFTSDGLEADPF